MKIDISVDLGIYYPDADVRSMLWGVDDLELMLDVGHNVDYVRVYDGAVAIGLDVGPLLLDGAAHLMYCCLTNRSQLVSCSKLTDSRSYYQ